MSTQLPARHARLQPFRAAGIPGFHADALLDLIHSYEGGHTSAVTADVERVTGRKPIGFDQFARDHAGSFR